MSAATRIAPASAAPYSGQMAGLRSAVYFVDDNSFNLFNVVV